MANPRKCKRCNTIIASDRDYCDAHYIEALQKYDEDMEKYERRKESWRNKSAVEKAYLNSVAEDDTRRGISGTLGCFTGIFIGAFVWIGVAKVLGYDSDNLDGGGMLLMFGSLLFFGAVFSKFLSNFPGIGRLIRFLLIGSIYYLLIAGILGSIIYDDEIMNHTLFLVITGIVSYLIALKQELNGTFFSTAEPSQPTRPSP